MSGTFPSGSFIMGTSVALEIETDNGIFVFHGTADPDRVLIRAFLNAGVMENGLVSPSVEGTPQGKAASE